MIENGGTVAFTGSLQHAVVLGTVVSETTTRPKRHLTPRMDYLKDFHTFLEQPENSRLMDKIFDQNCQPLKFNVNIDRFIQASYDQLEGWEEDHETVKLEFEEAREKKLKTGSLLDYARSTFAAEKYDQNIKQQTQIHDDLVLAAEISDRRRLKNATRSADDDISHLLLAKVEQWALQSELRVLGYAHYTLRDDYKRRVWFERYGEFEGQDPKEIQIFLEEKYQHFANPVNPQLT